LQNVTDGAAHAPTAMYDSQPKIEYAPSPSSEPAFEPQPASHLPLPAPAPEPMPTPAPLASPPAPVAKSRLPMIAGIVLGIGVLGAGGLVAYNELIAKKETTEVVASNGSDQGSGRAGSAAATGSGSDVGSADAGSGSDTGSAAGSGSDSGSAGSASTGSGTGSGSDSGSGAGSGSAVAVVPPDAGTGGASEKPLETNPTQASDMLQVSSKPKGARVFIDGADQGTTPIKVPGTADQHTLAVLLPGHELYLAEVKGQGAYDVALKPITPNGGHAGIKVQKCKDKERYYVYVDGLPTGMTCPTERIDTNVGPHTVEVYDIVTETRRKFDIVVKDERLSVRVKIEN